MTKIKAGRSVGNFLQVSNDGGLYKNGKGGNEEK